MATNSTYHPPDTRVTDMEVVYECILQGVWDGHLLIHANAPTADMQISAVAMQIGVYFYQTFLIGMDDAVPDIFEHCIFARLGGVQNFIKYFPNHFIEGKDLRAIGKWGTDV